MDWLIPIVYKPRSEGITDLCVKEGDHCLMSDELENAISAAHGQKVSEVKVDPTPDGKPPYKRKIKTEAETVAELKGLTISTEVDPNYKDEAESEDDDGSKTRGED
jgi:hypothetical protein